MNILVYILVLVKNTITRNYLILPDIMWEDIEQKDLVSNIRMSFS